jgi:glycerol uptake facilitator protein
MNPLVAEFLGTLILVFIGDGVCANVCLSGTKGWGSGWIVITTGWGLAVFVAVACTQEYSGAHINPAVTIGLAAAGQFAWSQVAGYIAAQLAGAFFGAVLVFLFYIQHFRQESDANAKLGTFCTAPAIKGIGPNLFGEIGGTFVLVFAVLCSIGPTMSMDGEQLPIGLGSLGALPVGLIVLAIGLGLGGTTGYAINPARDVAPRLAHAVLPIPQKRDSDWSYSWIPIAGPIMGGIVAAIVFILTVASGR